MASIFGGPDGAFSAPIGCVAGVALRDVVHLQASDLVAKADGTSQATGPAIGLVAALISPVSCLLAYDGEIPGFAGLVPGTVYFLDVVAGAITATPPSAVGNVLQRIGWARNATTLVVEIDNDFQVL